MNNVCVIYANGKKVRCSYFPDDRYRRGKALGTIKGARRLSKFDILIVKLLGKFTY